MIREIRKKMVVLGNRVPFSDMAKSCFNNMEKNSWIAGNMILEGSFLSRSHIEALVAGNCILEASVGDHVMAQRLALLLEKMYQYSEEGHSLSLKLISRFKNIMDGEDEGVWPEYRRKNLMLPEYDYMAKLPAEIPGAMEELELYIQTKKDVSGGSRQAFEAAVKIHNTIIEIMPYEQGNRVVARAAMMYYLMLRGYPVIFPEVKETEYNELVYRYLKTGSGWALEEILIEGILAHLELMIQLTAY